MRRDKCAECGKEIYVVREAGYVDGQYRSSGWYHERPDLPLGYSLECPGQEDIDRWSRKRGVPTNFCYETTNQGYQCAKPAKGVDHKYGKPLCGIHLRMDQEQQAETEAREQEQLIKEWAREEREAEELVARLAWRRKLDFLMNLRLYDPSGRGSTDWAPSTDGMIRVDVDQMVSVLVTLSGGMESDFFYNEDFAHRCDANADTYGSRNYYRPCNNTVLHSELPFDWTDTDEVLCDRHNTNDRSNGDE